MFENIRLSLQGIWAHKMRSFLTMLGIIIGIASIIAIVSTIKGTNEQIKKNIVGSGDNAVVVELYNESWPIEFGYETMSVSIPEMTEEVRAQVEAENTIETASLVRMRDVYEGIYYKNTGLTGCTITGIDTRYFDVYNYDLLGGRMFTDSDYGEYKKVVLLDKVAADSLFQNENPLGATIELMGEPFIVVGVVERTESFTPKINNIEDYYTYMSNDSCSIFVPDVDWPTLFTYDEPQSLVAKAVSVDDMTVAGRVAANIMNEYAGLSTLDETNTYLYKSQDLLEQAKQLQEVSESTNKQLIWIASISLLVGGIGVMNIMLVSVTERTREIGLKKAIGARKGRILGQFLTEASVLTSFGGLVGVAGGIGLAAIVSRISGTPMAISIPAIIFSVVFSMFIGILFGLLPSIKAANLNPIEALRYQ